MDRDLILELKEKLNIELIENPQNEFERKPYYRINNFEEVECLSLSGIDLSKLTFQFDSFNKLKDLRISFCELKVIPDSILKILNLEKLFLTGNDLKHIPNSIESLINLEWLSIRRCELKEIPNGIFQLKNLKILNASANYLTSVPTTILKLNKLINLDIGHNYFEFFPHIIGEIKGLKIFEYYGNSLKEFPKSILKLLNLTEIHFKDCNLGSLPNGFSDLEKLEVISLGNNELAAIPPILYDLRLLEKLFLDSNLIWKIQPEIKRLKNLKFLDLSDNELTEFPVEILELCNLEELNLYRNNLTEIPSQINRLTVLKSFNISNNSIKKIPVEICKFQNVVLNGNELTQIPLDVIKNSEQIYFDRNELLSSFNFTGNPITKPPVEIVVQGKEACIAWYKSQLEQTESLKEIKVIVLGDGAAGKTSLISRLINDTFNPNETLTQGVNISQVNFTKNHLLPYINNPKEAEIILNIWDFGGQEIMHATHQFFLSKQALYILVVDSRKDPKIDYWLSLISLFGGDSPIFIVINKIDESPSYELNRKSLQEKFSIKGFFPVSCKSRKGLTEFFIALIEHVSQSSLLKENWNLKWLSVKNALQSMKKNYISYERFINICKENDLDDKIQQKTLLGYLSSLGVILHFPDFELKDTNVLNPRWVTEAVYKIINSKLLAGKKGILTKNDLDFILNEEQNEDLNTDLKLNAQYSPTEQNHIINLMFKFELCYLYDSSSFLVPDLLPVDEPDFSFNFNNSLKYILEYDFLPKSTIAQFIVKFNEHIKNDLSWRTGVVLNFEGNQAVVKSDEGNKRVFIWVNGNDKRGYLAIIRSIFIEINKKLQRQPEELIPCICSKCLDTQSPYFFKYSVLLNARHNKKYTWPCERSLEDVSILNMIDDIIIDNNMEKNEDRISIVVNPTFNQINEQKQINEQIVSQSTTVSIDIKLSIELPRLQEEFEDFKSYLEDAISNNDANRAKILKTASEVGEKLYEVNSDSDKEKITGRLTKLGAFLRKLGDKDSEIGKTVSGLSTVKEYAQKLGRTYNKFAQWIPTLPVIPDLFL